MWYLDSHCHLDLFDNMDEFLRASKRYNYYTITMTTTPRAYQKNVELCRECSRVYVALGLHPQLITDREKELDILLKYIEESKFIGEIGIDRSPKHYRTTNAQVRVFTEIVDKCDWYGNKVISIHSVRAADVVLEILRSYVRNKTNKYIMHWYSGSIKTLQDAIKLGCFFSVNSQMVKSDHGRKIISMLPKERMLLESDAPFVTTFQRVQDHIQYLGQVVEMISEIRREDISKQILTNGLELLS